MSVRRLHRFNFFWITLALLFSTPLSCLAVEAPGDSEKNGDYYPLNKGNYWKYKWTSYSGDAPRIFWMTLRDVDRELRADGASLHHVEELLEGDPAVFAARTIRQHYLQTNKGVYESEVEFPDDLAEPDKSQLLFLRKPLVSGD